MDRSDRELFESIAGPLLEELGYATGDGPGTEARPAEPEERAS
jgi:hypothetical protein